MYDCFIAVVMMGHLGWIWDDPGATKTMPSIPHSPADFELMAGLWDGSVHISRDLKAVLCLVTRLTSPSKSTESRHHHFSPLGLLPMVPCDFKECTLPLLLVGAKKELHRLSLLEGRTMSHSPDK